MKLTVMKLTRIFDFFPFSQLLFKVQKNIKS